MIVFPSCKINLGLRVTNKREDGFHDIDTIMYPLPFHDILEILPSNTLKFTTHGIPIPGDSSQNLCLKAYHLLQFDYNLPPVHIDLRKQIPIGAGLGGGSADAAFTLIALNKLFTLGLSIEQLESYASQLGSDCAFFIQNRPAHATGRGELLSPISLNLKGYFLLLIHPEIHVSTADAYGSIIPAPAPSVQEIINQPMELWQEQLINDFETPIFKLHPTIEAIKSDLYQKGASYASMSGSGSSVFGIFSERPEWISQLPYWNKCIQL